MTDLTKLFKAMSALHVQTQEPLMVNPGDDYKFPFPQSYAGQDTVIREMKGFKQAALTSPTGTGKSAVVLSLTRDEATIVIEPRKFLQKQISGYYDDYVLFGRSEYKCFHAVNAAKAPCNRKTECLTLTPETKTIVPQDCVEEGTGASCDPDHPCKIFQTKQGAVKFPCRGCEYIGAQIEAKRTLQAKGTVICNFGNFWPLLQQAKIVVIDEADLFFREIAKPTKMMYSNKNDSEDSIKDLLTREMKGLDEAIKKTPANQAYTLQNLLYNVSFLLANADLCFKYQRRDKIYVEINPDNTNVLKDKIFKNKRLLIVSATLGEFNIPRYGYTVWQRRATYYCPVGKLTSKNLKANPWIMGVAAERIETITAVAEGMYDTHKFPIHCGNIGTHATALNNLLGPDRKHLYCNVCGERVEDISPEAQMVKCPKCGRKWEAREERCTMHKAGNLMQTIDTFVENDMRYLLIAGADYGGNFDWAKLQIILKFPYGSLDEKMRVLERTMGKKKFNKYYVNEAISRFVQQCGRTCRGFGDFGVTIVLDSKMMDVYRENPESFPDWWKQTFDGKCY